MGSISPRKHEMEIWWIFETLEPRNFETKKLWNQETKKPRNQEPPTPHSSKRKRNPVINYTWLLLVQPFILSGQGIYGGPRTWCSSHPPRWASRDRRPCRACHRWGANTCPPMRLSNARHRVGDIYCDSMTITHVPIHIENIVWCRLCVIGITMLINLGMPRCSRASRQLANLPWICLPIRGAAHARWMPNVSIGSLWYLWTGVVLGLIALLQLLPHLRDSTSS